MATKESSITGTAAPVTGTRASSPAPDAIAANPAAVDLRAPKRLRTRAPSRDVTVTAMLKSGNSSEARSADICSTA